MNGFVVIDKPLGLSSRDAVDRVQAALPKGTRVGHTGTLDPLASGVLVLALGQATRLTDYVQRQTKEYRAEVRFGATSATDDAEGPITPNNDAVPATREQLDGALRGFFGEVEQTPPAFSAAHVDGRRAYKLARKGEEVSLSAKRVRIDRIDLIDYSWPRAEMEIQCGKGTYIRSIARDLGHSLGCGAYLTALRRTRVGPFHEGDALGLDATGAELLARLRPLVDAVAELPTRLLSEDESRRLRMGQRLYLPGAEPRDEIAVLDLAGELLAIASIEEQVLHPKKVFGPK